MWQMLKDGLDLWIAWVCRVLKQHGGILSGRGRGTDDPLPVDIGHQGSLPLRTGYWFGAEARKARSRIDRC